jgi:cytochrome c oxidase cbb3-type subunit III
VILAGLLLFAPVTSYAADPMTVGQAQFDRACAGCHGPGGTGGRGPSLRKQLTHGNTASDLRAVIRNGIPGTGMPKFHFDSEELEPLVAYVQSLSRGGFEADTHGGDPAEGRRIYDKLGCANCHKIGTDGSALGPNLTRIGSARSYGYLRSSLLNPSADVPEEYQAVTVVTQEGRSITGIRMNEDSFTVQLRLPDQSFLSFDKQTLKEEVPQVKSLMQPYALQEHELVDLLAYLTSLSGNGAADVEPGEKRR